jgi:hypothetical protein
MGGGSTSEHTIPYVIENAAADVRRVLEQIGASEHTPRTNERFEISQTSVAQAVTVVRTEALRQRGMQRTLDIRSDAGVVELGQRLDSYEANPWRTVTPGAHRNRLRVGRRAGLGAEIRPVSGVRQEDGALVFESGTCNIDVTFVASQRCRL